MSTQWHDNSNPATSTADTVLAFCANGKERGRLTQSIGPLEFERSREVIGQHLPVSPAVMYDIGGGPGAYSCWLAGLGYAVHLLDLTPLHVEQAKDNAARSGVALASARVGDALRLPYESDSADAVILHGPLYHLTERDDRLAVLAEAARVLRPGGTLLAFAISHTASTIVGLLREWVWDADYRSMCVAELRTGRHDRPGNWPGLFPDGFFHSPAQLGEELQAAGFLHECTRGIQGPAWMALNFAEDWKDAKRREALLEIARAAEAVPALSPHMVAIARKAAQTAPAK